MTTDAPVTIATVELFQRGLSALQVKVKKLNRRAERHGMDKLEMRVVSSETVERKLPNRMVVPDTRYVVDIVGCEPRIDGWHLAARIEFNGTIGNVVRIAPGRDDDGSYRIYRTIDPVCEHCNTTRRRNDVFVLEDCDGNRKIIGRNCLADYLRSGDADDLARWAEFADQIRDYVDGDGADSDDFDGRDGGMAPMHLVPYMRVVAVAKRTFGWTGRAAAKESFDGIATADTAGRIIFGRGRAHDNWIEENDLVPRDGDNDYVDRAIAWAVGLKDADCNEYLDTIRRIAYTGLVEMGKLDGYAASILIAYDKACEREIEYADRKAKAKNKVWIGSAKKRERNVSVVCKGLNSFEGQYGTTTLVRFEHYPDGPDGADKAILVWFASGDRWSDWEVDKEYTVDFTCKDHNEHDKYGKQTRINRVKKVGG
jgi:hypothetical protein